MRLAGEVVPSVFTFARFVRRSLAGCGGQKRDSTQNFVLRTSSLNLNLQFTPSLLYYDIHGF